MEAGFEEITSQKQKGLIRRYTVVSMNQSFIGPSGDVWIRIHHRRSLQRMAFLIINTNPSFRVLLDLIYLRKEEDSYGD